MTEGRAKVALLVVCDVMFVNLALILSVALWYGGYLPGEVREVSVISEGAWFWLLWMGLAASAVNVGLLMVFRLYGLLWRYAGVDELLKIFAVSVLLVAVLILLDAFLLGQLAVLPRRVFAVAWFMLFSLTTVSRLGERIFRRLAVTVGYMISSKSGVKRVMVVGAGYAGYELVRGMLHSPRRERLPVLIVDDDPAVSNAHIMGIRIARGVDNIPYLAAAHAVDEITIAIPEADNAQLRHIFEFCTQTDCRLTMVPPISEVSGAIPGVREVSIGDLLFRDEIKLDIENIRRYIEGRCVLVTGGGSIGSELCRQLTRYAPRCILIVDIYENNAFDLMQELSEKHRDIEILLRIGSIRDRARMDELFAEFRPDVVFHTAAHKHVSTQEDSPAEAVKNNIFGTLNIVRSAIAHECGRFVLISSDKAVRPTNIYGASKRVAELIMQREAARSSGKTLLSAVRFGNVLDSRGSIIPKFKRQIAQGGPITVYGKDVERFFMTIGEACQLVLQAAGLSGADNNGHIFILDMGKPVNIDDLARKLIRLSGYRPDEDIKIAYSPLLPGEKIAEELVLPEEKDGLQLTCHNKIWMAPAIARNYSDFDAQMDRLLTFSQQEPSRISEALMGMDLHYNPLLGPALPATPQA